MMNFESCFIPSLPAASFSAAEMKPILLLYPIEDTDWKVVSVHSLSSYTSKSTTIFNFMLMAALFSLAVSIVILVMISSAITRPLNKLASLMENVQNGNFNVRFHPKYRWENWAPLSIT